MSGKLLLRGIYGSVKGKEFYIELGQSVTLGRSRSCDITLGRDGENTQTIVHEGVSEEAHFRSVSRKHMRISFLDEEVKIEDLSSNGSYLDGDRVEDVSIHDFKEEVHVILLGTKEKFILEYID
ncbi:FHA domain-containing protein [Candidatus Uabimicrobium amorphum]|uniref:FHA domain-containing protein n=1 Tax=Uabimicrobium amorphum TaxID=2596890 RepID=A0A5S9IT92_UABAM|nr:FHA domain-containing protein [Candidatus Uabimicrobium amorphum]BBM87524.1 hypothetical protein UABAM_05936 [Candidatus Uabimicrobium amorphum]